MIFSFLIRVFIRDIFLPRAWYILLHGGSYCSVLFSLAVFPTACFLSSLDRYFSGCTFSRSLAVVISLAPLFSLVAPSLFLAAPIVCTSLAVLLYFASPWLLLYAVHYTMHCCASRPPLLVASCLLPSFGFGCRCYLLTSPSLFLPALSSGSLYRHSSSLAVVRASALALSFHVSLCLAGASLTYGSPGILARVFLTVFLSPGDSPLPFQLFASWLIISTFVSFSTFLGVLLRSPDSMRLSASSSFVSFNRFLWGCPLLFLFLLMATSYFFYFTDLCPFADPFDRMWVWLFFLYLCRLLIICLPLTVHVRSPCHLSMRSLPHVLDFPPVVPPSWALSSFPP